MGKKPAVEPLSKKQKQKHKEMFTELATNQEEIVQHKYPTLPTYNKHHKRVIHEDSEEQIELDVLQRQTNNIDAVCEAVHKLLSKNKVSAKNAFDVPLIDLQQLPDFSQSLQNEYAWKRLSSTLQNDYKIYGYRVDAIHSITYNILHTMSRRQQDIELQNVQVQPQPIMLEQQSIKIGENTIQDEYIEKKIQNLNVMELELALGMDPILERTKRQFDLLGQSSMMLNTLPIDMSLRLQLVNNKSQNDKYPPYGIYTDQWKIDDPLMAFVDLSNFRQKFEQNYQGKIKNQQCEQLFYDEKQNDFNGYNSNAVWDQSYTSYKKAITQEIQFKHRIFRSDKDLIEDAENWMGDIDRKFLGMHSKKGRAQPISQMKSETKVQDPADMIDFLAADVQQNTRTFIFKPQSDKQQHREEIEDRFLLVPKMVQPFSVSQHSIFLKEMVQPSEDMYQPNNDAEVDVRRQMISILQAKKKIKDQLHTRSTFKNIYSNFTEAEDISPALCFLTVLHLANEHELNLEQIDETNFYVR